jgi:hypothetical protein
MQFVEISNDFIDQRKVDSDLSSKKSEDEDDAYSPKENIALSQYGKIERERELFLRAALQLLEQETSRDQQPVDTSNARTMSDPLSLNPNTPAHLATSRLAQRNSLKGSKAPQCDVSSDIIRYGTLRKAGRNSMAFSSMKPHWKNRYVELRFGKFTYEHEASNIHWGQQFNPTSNHEVANNHRKEILLTVDTCQCRPFKIRSPNGSCVFELTHYGGPRRLWMAGSERERDAWVTAILKAMVGSLDDQLGIGHELRLKVFTRQVEMPSMSTSIAEESSNSSRAIDSDRDNSSNIVSQDKNPRSWEGPAAPFAGDIARFVTVQAAVSKALDSTSYQSILQRLRARHINIVIPVYYVKVSKAISFSWYSCNLLYASAMHPPQALQ